MSLVQQGERLIRVAEPEDSFTIELRDMDKRELEAVTSVNPQVMVEISRLQSDWCLTFECFGKPVAVFGVAPHDFGNNWGVPWLLGSVDIEDNFLTFGKWSKPFLGKMLRDYEVLQNFVHAENKLAIVWLKWLGFRFSELRPMGRFAEPFYEFTLTRS